MPILTLQSRGQQVGRIRMGQKITTEGGRSRPVALSTWRLTTGSRAIADQVAVVLGGQVREWEKQWEVVTDLSEIPVMVPPRESVITQWYELWSKGGCLRRCDGVTEQLTGSKCLCPAAERVCTPKTRLSVMIPDLPSLGVWRLDTGSFYAAGELGDTAMLMEAARERGVILPAILRIDDRQRVAGGKTKTFKVPVLEATVTYRQIVTGELDSAGVLPPRPGMPAALGSATTPRGELEAASPTAAQLATEAANAVDVAELRRIGEVADAYGLFDEQVPGGVLREVLRGEWARVKDTGGVVDAEIVDDQEVAV